MPTDKQFTQYRRKQIAELRPYIEGEDVSHVSISPEDAKAGSPKHGDMIARNPKNHADQWLIARTYFLDNFEALTAAEQAEPNPDTLRDERGLYVVTAVRRYAPGKLGWRSRLVADCSNMDEAIGKALSQWSNEDAGAIYDSAGAIHICERTIQEARNA